MDQSSACWLGQIGPPLSVIAEARVARVGEIILDRDLRQFLLKRTHSERGGLNSSCPDLPAAQPLRVCSSVPALLRRTRSPPDTRPSPGSRYRRPVSSPGFSW